MDPLTVALLSAGIGAAGSIGGGMLARGENQETKIQKQKRKLIDDLLMSLKGQGSYNDLFEADYDTFQKSYVDPAKALFKNQIAPQIQQQYIATGQQRGTGLDDTLARAGVDMDNLLNQQYGSFQQDAMNRRAGAINSVLGADAGAPNQQSAGNAFAQATGGYLSSPGFQTNIQSILDTYRPKNKIGNDDPFGTAGGRRGFAQ